MQTTVQSPQLPVHNHPDVKFRTVDARRDTLDFRDQMFEATLIEVPTMIALES